jgi:hypothetical protein
VGVRTGTVFEGLYGGKGIHCAFVFWDLGWGRGDGVSGVEPVGPGSMSYWTAKGARVGGGVATSCFYLCVLWLAEYWG